MCHGHWEKEEKEEKNTRRQKTEKLERRVNQYVERERDEEKKSNAQ